MLRCLIVEKNVFSKNIVCPENILYIISNYVMGLFVLT